MSSWSFDSASQVDYNHQSVGFFQIKSLHEINLGIRNGTPFPHPLIAERLLTIFKLETIRWMRWYYVILHSFAKVLLKTIVTGSNQSSKQKHIPCGFTYEMAAALRNIQSMRLTAHILHMINANTSFNFYVLRTYIWKGGTFNNYEMVCTMNYVDLSDRMNVSILPGTPSEISFSSLLPYLKIG